jgi:transposase-like protein
MNLEYNAQRRNQQIRQSKMSDPQEWERILMAYQGIFRKHIPDYIKKVVHKNKPQKNLSKWCDHLFVYIPCVTRMVVLHNPL